METSLFERAGKHIANGAWLYKEVMLMCFVFLNFTFHDTLASIILIICSQGVIETAPGMPEAKSEEAEEESKIIR